VFVMPPPTPPNPIPGRGAILARRLTAASPNAVGLLALAVVSLIGVADVLTGKEISSSVFYSLPVALGAWYSGSRWSLVLCVLSAATWYEADLLAGATYSASWIPIWNSGVRFAFFLVIAGLLTRLRAALAAQEALAATDALTGLANSRRFLAAADAEVARATRYRHAVSLAYMDLDGFKSVNDRLGHRVGDEVLAAVGRILRLGLRRTDVAARLGGDEFAVLFPETDGAAAREAMDKVRAALRAAMEAAGWPVGFSIGVVTSSGGVGSGEDLIHLADELMYEVKRSGKGRVTYRTAGPEGPGRSL